jgi:ribose transport system substrate-binding protein
MKSILATLVMGIALTLTSGCEKQSDQNQASAGNSSAPTAASTTPAEKTFTIGMSQSNLGEPWRVQMDADIKSAADKQPNLKIIFKDAQNDSLTQRSQVEEFVSQGVNLLIISPKEATPLTDPVAAAYDAGIPVIVLDRKVNGDKYTCFIGADNKKIGKAAGEWIKNTLGGKGNVVELEGLMTSTPGQERHEGFMDGIAGSDIKIIFRADMHWLEPDARKEMDSALSRFPNIDLVFAHNDDGAHGAYLSAQAAGREKQMKFVGIDALPQEGVQYVKQGILDATFQYPTGGAEAIDIAEKILHGEKVSKNITLGSRLFTKETVDQGGKALP